MKRAVVVLLLVALLALVTVGLALASGGPRWEQKRGGPAREPLQQEWVQELFVDYVNPSHAGPGSHPDTESSSFKLTQGGTSWFSDGDVKYEITGAEGVAGGNTAIEAAIATLDGFITTRTFTRDDGSPSSNPCGGVNTVRWAAIDGSGGILATASVCRKLVTKEIRGFVVTFDTGETWSATGEASKPDVENVGIHEFGHMAGLNHVNGPKDGCLTMYRFASDGETQKQTLGLGDKLGLDALYSTGDTSSGPGCGS